MVKETSRGQRIESTMRNPVRQVQIQAKVLRERLVEKGLALIVQPTVAFSNPAVEVVEREPLSVPVFVYPLQNLVKRIRAYEEKLANWPDLDMDLVKSTVEELHAEALRVSKPISK